MKIIIANDYEDMSRKAANYLSAQVIMKPDAVLGLATGETPIGTYKQLVEWYNKGDIDFSQTSTINLDEYKGLTGDHKQSYRYFMDTNLFDLINIKKSNTYLPNGMAKDEEAECARYENIIKELGNIDMQLLGIGLNGHIVSMNRVNLLKKLPTVYSLHRAQLMLIRDFSMKVKQFLKRHSQWGLSQSCSLNIFY